MATPVRDKYYLRTLHEEIGLFDRKLAHLLKYDSFASDQDRDTAAAKLAAKREQLVRAARQMADEGVEFKNSEVPRSLRGDEPEAAPVAAVQATPAPEPPAIAGPGRRSAAQTTSVLDFGSEIKAYIEKRRKSAPVTTEA